MTANIGRLDTQRALTLYADWTDRIAAGELPKAKPSRPQGPERNVVLTLWDWAGPKAYLHDEISTDRRDPRVNANGPIYGATEESTDLLPVLDPVAHAASQLRMPVRDPKTPSSKELPMAPSPYWGEEPIWDSQTTIHNPMMDEKGRVWFTSRVRPPENPEFCRKGSDHPSAKLFPLERANRHLSMYDPGRSEVHVDQHLLPDPSSRLRRGREPHALDQRRRSGERRRRLAQPQAVRGDRRRGRKRKAGRRSSSTPTATASATTMSSRTSRVDPAKDKRVVAALYSVAVNPVDGTVWGTSLGFPGRIVRLDPGQTRRNRARRSL